MTYMEAWRLAAPYLPIDTDERREAYLRYYKCEKCGMPLTTSEVDSQEYRDMKKKVAELEIKLYAVRKELKNCYENCFGAVGDHAHAGA